MSYIFLSYARADQDFAFQLRKELKESNIALWLDENPVEVHRSDWQRVKEIISESAAVLILVSPNSKNDKDVSRELRHAQAAGKPILSYLLEGENWSDYPAYTMSLSLNFELQEEMISELNRYLAQSQTKPLPAPLAKRYPPIANSNPSSLARNATLGIIILILVTVLCAISASSTRNTETTSTVSTETNNQSEQNTLSPLQLTQTSSRNILSESRQTQAAIYERFTQTAAAHLQAATQTAESSNTNQIDLSEHMRNTMGTREAPRNLQEASRLNANPLELRNNAAWRRRYPNYLVHEFEENIPMVFVPAGCFTMGSEEGENNARPAHELCFERGFWIDQTEVTRFVYLAPPDSYASYQPLYPMRDVTWDEALSFCESRGARLPSEAEWEYAARGVDSLSYPWGNEFDSRAIFYDGNFGIVASKPEGISWIGAYDMSGNALEWTSTIFGIDDGDLDFSDAGERRFTYPYIATDGRENLASAETNPRVLRGGSGNSRASRFVTSYYRTFAYPNNADSSRGFRCVRDS